MRRLISTEARRSATAGRRRGGDTPVIGSRGQPAAKDAGDRIMSLGFAPPWRDGSERILGELASHSHPLHLGEGLEACLDATYPAESGVLHTAEGIHHLVVDGLIV